MAAAPIMIKDKSGCLLPAQIIDGYVFLPGATPSKISKRLPNGLNDINAETFFDDDILICSYARSGFHWFAEMTSMLIRKSTKFDNITPLARNLELRPAELIPSDEKRPRILQTHLPAHLLPEKVLKLRKIFLYRNPKDVSHSLYKFVLSISEMGYNGCFADFLELFLEGKVNFGDWFTYMKSWEDFKLNNKIYFLSYEQLSRDPLTSMRNVVNFLDIKIDTPFMESVIKTCTLENMKRIQMPKIEVRSGISYFRKGKIHTSWGNHVPTRTGLDLAQQIHLLLEHGKPMSVQSVVGDWRNHFTEAMNEEFDKVYVNKMKATKFKIEFTL